MSVRDDLIAKLADVMDPDNALAFVDEALRESLLTFDARHQLGCPQRQQNYWRMRSEYRPGNYGPDKPCSCGLDDILGTHDDRKQG